MKLFNYIKEYPTRSLILFLILIWTFYVLNIAYIKYEKNSWFARHIDKKEYGLRVFYYDNEHFEDEITEIEVVDKLSFSSILDDRFKRNNFSLRAIGIFITPKTDRYKFFLTGDDVYRLYIDQDIIMDNIVDGVVCPGKDIRKTIPLKNGPHLVVIEYFQRLGDAHLDFSWKGTRERTRHNDLDLFFKPVRSNFLWDDDVIEFEKITTRGKDVLIYIMWISIAAILIWLILRFWGFIYSVFLKIWDFRKHPILGCFAKFAPCILVLASGVLTYRNIIFSTGPVLQMHDMEVLAFPKYYFMRNAFIMGEFPFWDPYTMLGQPCSFGMGLAMLYPLLLGFLSLGFLGPLVPRHLELFIVGHLLFSGLTMYWSARKLGLSRLGACLAGIVFQMAIINKDVIYSTIALDLPWIVLSITYAIIVFRSKAPALSNENVIPLIITILTLVLIILVAYPNLIVYTFLTLGITVIYYIMISIREKDWLRILSILKKSVLVFLAPLLLTAFAILPGCAILKDSIRFGAEVVKFGPLYLSHVWTLLFPGFANSLEPSFAYTGVIPVLLAVYFCITKKKGGINDGFLFVIFAIFWFYYSLENSLLDKFISIFPILNKLRFSQYALIIYVYAVSILAGKGLEKRILNLRESKLGLNINWLFPVFIISMLISTGHYFSGVIQHGYYTGSPIPIIFGITFVLFSIKLKSEKLRIILFRAIPVVAILEIFLSSPPFYSRSEASAFFPYEMKLDRFKNNYPEAFINRDLYRVENFSEYPMAEYYFNRFSTYGYYGQGMQPARYYYLWNISGNKGPRYEKWWVEGDRSNWIMPISLESKLYDLAGVRYFYLPEHEWLFIDYKQAGKGEWIEMELAKDVLAYGVGLYNAPGGRWPTEAALVLNDVTEIDVEVAQTEGWHKFYFNPVVLNKLKIVVKEVVPYDINEGSRGVVIGEVELLDKEGNGLDVEVKEFNASSSMLVSNPSMIMDNRLGHVWHSGCSILANNTLPSKNLERLREGCYINKDVLARAFIVHRYKYLKDTGELRQELHSDSFEPEDVILLEGLPIDFNIPDGPYSDNAEIVSYKLNEVEVTVKNDKPGFLILTDMYATGWKVFVDGVEDKLLIADGLFRGVFIEDGEHKVLFKYRPPFLGLGLIISLITLVSFIKLLPQRLKGTEGTKKKY